MMGGHYSELEQAAGTTIMRRCSVHWFDEAVATCRDCGSEACEHCLVQVRGLGSFCKECAMVRSGVRRRRCR